MTWNWNLFELSNDEISNIRVQETMSKNRVEFNQFGFQSEINTYFYSKQFLGQDRYFFSTGWVDNAKSIAKTGEIIVEDQKEIEIKIVGQGEKCDLKLYFCI